MSSSLVALLLLLMSASITQAWVSPAHQPWSPGATGGASPSTRPSPPRFGRSSLSPRSKPVTRWDAQLERARSAHRLKNWTEVQLWCSKVIDLADDWNAVEQAHLRLALAAQKSGGVEAGRRAFQHGIRDCPSSDTLLLAWALMESKIKHSDHSKKRSWALLRRAIALNPKKNSKVLKWSVFAADLLAEAAGGAAAEVVRSAFSPPPPPPPPPTGSAAAEAVGITSAAVGSTSSSSSSIRAKENTRRDFAGWEGKNKEEENSLAVELLALCYSNKALHEGQQEEEEEEKKPRNDVADLRTCSAPSSLRTPAAAARAMPAATPTAVPAAAPAATTSSAAPSAKFQELAGELERRGGGARAGVRALSGTWRLVFTTCAECDRVLSRTGSEVYQRLTPPIMAIKPTPSCKQPAPFRCEVLLRPSTISGGGGNGGGGGGGGVPASCEHEEIPPLASPLQSLSSSSSSPFNRNKGPHVASTATSTPKASTKAAVAYYFRGWADSSPPSRQREGSLLKQHVAARSATVIVASGGGGGENANGSSERLARVPSPTPPAAVFSTLGLVAPGGKGLEKLATQEVTYVGKQLRIGRTSDGDVYVYQRCAWPCDMDVGLMV